MGRTSSEEEIITRYLLGELSEPEQVALETACFADKEVFDRVWAAEGDLIDDYLGGKLPPGLHTRFEQHFLSSPARQERVQAARILLRCISQAGTQSPALTIKMSPAKRFQSLFVALRGPKLSAIFAGAVAILVIALVGGWIGFETIGLRRQLLASRAEQAALQLREKQLQEEIEVRRGQTEELSAELARTRDQLNALEADEQSSTSRSVVSFFLTGGAVRSNGRPQTLTIRAGVEKVKLRLKLETNDYEVYRALLQTPEGREIYTWGRIRPIPLPSGSTVVLTVAAAALSSEDYILKIKGKTPTGELEDISKYYFRVER